MNRIIALASAALAVCVCSGTALAAPTVFTGSGTQNSHAVSASVSFEVTGANTLTVILANTASTDCQVPSDILTAMFFSMAAGSPAFTLTQVSAITTNGSNLFYPVDNTANVNVGGEWAYGSSLAPPAPIGALPFGISSSGLNLFGSGNFNGPNLDGPPSGAVDGVQYGITSAGDNSATANGGLSGSHQVHNSVTFTLSFTGTFNPASINDVYFLYGTATDEGGFHSPTPGAAALMGLGGLLASRRKRS